MSRVLTNEQNYYDIADTIRQMKDVNTTYKPREMASALKDIYSNEVEGVPPLTFESNGMPLIDYRIDGAIGGVGDKTANYFNSTISNGYHLDSSSGLPVTSSTRCATLEPVSIDNVNSLILTFDSTVTATKFMYSLFSDNTLIRRVANLNSGATIDTTNANKIYFAFYRTDSASAILSSSDLSNIMLSEQNIDFVPSGYKISIKISGKNLWNDNITFENGTINQNSGTNSSYASDYRIRSNFTDYIEPGQYTLNVEGVDRINTIALYSEKNIESFVQSIVTTSIIPKTFSLQTGGYIRVALSKVNGDIVTPSEISNIQLERGQIATNYETYHEPTTTNIYLDEPIEENESISLSDTEVDIPTIEGTNILTINTTVQPSNVYIQARKDPDEIVYLTNFLKEEI